MHPLLTSFLLFSYLTLAISSGDEKSISLCTRLYPNGTFSGHLKFTSITWESDGTNQSLNTANLLMIFEGERGYRVAPSELHVDSILIREESEEGKKNGLRERTFQIDKALHRKLEEVFFNRKLPILGYYQINIKEHQKNAGHYVFLYNKMFMIRKLNGSKLKLFQGYPICSVFHGQLEKDVITAATKDPRSEHYLLSPVRLDLDIEELDFAVEDTNLHINILSKRSYFPVLSPTGHLRLVHVLNGPPSEPPMFSSLPQGTVNYATGVLYLFDDDLACVYTVPSWGHMDLLERSINTEMDIVLPIQCTTYENFFKCSNLKLNKSNRPNRCSCTKLKGEDLSLEPQMQLSLHSLLIVILSATILVLLFCGFSLFCRRGRKTSKNRKRMLKWTIARKPAVSGQHSMKKPQPPCPAKATAAAKSRSFSKTSIFGSGSRATRSTISHQDRSVISTLSPS